MQGLSNFIPGFRLQDGSELQKWLRQFYLGQGRQTGFLGAKIFRAPAPKALTTSATLVSADIIAGSFTANQGGGAAATYTLPTAAIFNAALPADFAVDDALEFVLTNISVVAAEDITIATAAGWTLVGKMTVESNDAVTSNSFGRFRIRKTATTPTFTLYRVG